MKKFCLVQDSSMILEPDPWILNFKGSNMEALIRIFLNLISSTRTVINYCKKISFLWIELKTILTHIWYTYAICFQILSVLWLSKHLLHVYMTHRFYRAPKSCRNTVFSILNIKFIKHVRKMQYIYGTLKADNAFEISLFIIIMKLE